MTISQLWKRALVPRYRGEGLSVIRHPYGMSSLRYSSQLQTYTPSQNALLEQLRGRSTKKLVEAIKSGSRFLDEHLPLLKTDFELARRLYEQGELPEAFKLIKSLACLSNKKLPSSRNYRLSLLKNLFGLSFVKKQHETGFIYEFTDQHRDLFAYGVRSMMIHNSDLWKMTNKSTMAQLGDQKKYPELSQRQVFHFLVHTSLMMENPRWAAYTYEKMLMNGDGCYDVSQDLLILRPIISHLLVKVPDNDMENLKLISKLVRSQNEAVQARGGHKYEMSVSELNQLLENVSMIPKTTPQSLRLRREVFELVTRQMPSSNEEGMVTTWQDMDDFNLRESYLSFGYEIIEQSIEFTNEAPVFKVWYIIKSTLQNIYEASGDTRKDVISSMRHLTVLAKVVTFFSRSGKYIGVVPEVLRDVPMKGCLECPQLASALIMYAARTKNFEVASNIVDLLAEVKNGSEEKRSLTRGELNALLRLHLEMNDNDGVQRILKSLYEEHGGASHADLNMVIHKMLYINNDIVTASRMLEQLPPTLAKSGIITMLNYMIDNDQMDFAKIQNMYSQMEAGLSPADPVWLYWTSAYFKYLTCKFEVDVAQNVYLMSLNERKSEDCPIINAYGVHNNPFRMRHENVRIYLPNRLRSLVLRTISHSCISKAKACEEGTELTKIKEVFRWTLAELKKSGLETVDLVVDFKRHIKVFREVGLEFPEDEMDEAAILSPNQRRQRFDNYWTGRDTKSMRGPKPSQLLGKHKRHREIPRLDE
ncbi:unnamed protein product [Kuraishia capsulata CBS 1993]|uniref:Uncharacterized protein n=1 Tax=Kuraishia capsulata CBS 1993 TaxID=1382522 RepID=W6MN97_9ASCO|nr:uncharacterized protein KUCA_T00004105001 [Kuraishia capsulata CBS 1993]CDK28124.1 unnamed protein product [Kuraishia capsulata CBS 1993]